MGLYRIFTLTIYELAISPLITLNTIYFHVSCINFVCVCVCKRDTRVVLVFFSINIKTNNELKNKQNIAAPFRARIEICIDKCPGGRATGYTARREHRGYHQVSCVQLELLQNKSP